MYGMFQNGVGGSWRKKVSGMSNIDVVIKPGGN